MGYESKIYFVKPYGFKLKSTGRCPSQIVAMIDMDKMGYDDEVNKFRNLFNKEMDFSLYLPDYDAKTDSEIMMDVTEDKYGKQLCYADINELIKQIDKVIATDPTYVRFQNLKAMLKTFKKDPEIYVVHYGH